VGWFNVESEGELDLLNQFGQRARVALRLNPNVQASTHHYIATGHSGAKFGMSADTIRHILENRQDFPNLDIAAIHIHIGSQLGDVQATVEAVKRAQALAQAFDIHTLNIGGGYPVAYTPEEAYPAPSEFVEALAPLLDGWKTKLEPGRFIMANAGLLLVSVLYVKEQDGQRFIITDGSMTELNRPALYDALHPIYPVAQSEHASREAMIVGPVCETADVLGHQMPLPEVKPGNLLAITMAGAYGMVMASNYNQRPRPAEILVEGDSWRVIRRRETWDDLLQQES
jgi:diaminopimelate decarboxylase